MKKTAHYLATENLTVDCWIEDLCAEESVEEMSDLDFVMLEEEQIDYREEQHEYDCRGDWVMAGNCSVMIYTISAVLSEKIQKCKDIINKEIDAEDAEQAIEQLRSMLTEKAISFDEYNFMLSNWDDLLEK